MITSRRPNNRASTEKAPGPRHTKAVATTAASMVVIGVSNKPTRGPGNHGKTPSKLVIAATTAAHRLREPINSNPPTTVMKTATAEVIAPSSCLSAK